MQECLLEDIHTAARIQDSTEDTYSCSPTKTDPCPNMDFCKVFWSVKSIILYNIVHVKNTVVIVSCRYLIKITVSAVYTTTSSIIIIIDITHTTLVQIERKK